MDKEIVSVKPTDDLDYCMDLITNKRVRHLPVLLGGEWLELFLLVW
jgi:CBS domain-containing protein